MRKIFNMIGIYIVGILGIIVLAAILFLNLSPRFGKGLSKAQKNEYAKLDNFHNGKFVNQKLSSMELNYQELLKEYKKKSPNTKPAKNILVEKIDSIDIENYSHDITQVIWFGHSTFLLIIDGKKILLDPMLSQKPSPISFFGTSRFSKELPISAEKLPFIDIVVLSHDHYDHLDYESILKLKKKVGQFITPLGLANHLVKWGVEKTQIIELNWWQNIEYENIKFTCTPARHFSGRGIFDRETSLWCSWAIEGKNEKLFFSGDGGYGSHFKQIGEELGPFDIALMECGQYNTNWKHLHMMPEETAQASIDLKSKLVLPIHWGGFSLAFHHWTEPIERLLDKANELNLSVTTPKIGEAVILGNRTFPKEKWWIDFTDSNKSIQEQN